jgi:hypothetical protein
MREAGLPGSPSIAAAVAAVNRSDSVECLKGPTDPALPAAAFGAGARIYAKVSATWRRYQAVVRKGKNGHGVGGRRRREVLAAQNKKAPAQAMLGPFRVAFAAPDRSREPIWRRIWKREKGDGVCPLLNRTFED